MSGILYHGNRGVMMNSEHIRYFLEVVKYGSINKASEKLNINHQHLGRILTSLENEIGAKLLERNRVGVTLTPQGIEAIEIMREIDTLTTQLRYRFSTETDSNNKVLKLFSPASNNHHIFNALAKKIQKLIPNIAVELIEAPEQVIIDNLRNNTELCFGRINSFDDYPNLRVETAFFPENIKVINEKNTRLVMLAATANPISKKYNSISLDSLITKPLVLYAPYDIEYNHFYKLLHVYGEPKIKYKTSNLQTFYDLLRTTECVSIGVSSDNQDAMFNPLFSQDQQLRMIPIRENVQMRILYLANQKLYTENRGKLYDIIADNFNTKF